MIAPSPASTMQAEMRRWREESQRLRELIEEHGGEIIADRWGLAPRIEVRWRCGGVCMCGVDDPTVRNLNHLPNCPKYPGPHIYWRPDEAQEPV